MQIEYNNKVWNVEQVTGDVYRAYEPKESLEDSGVVFTVEYRGGGSYFKFRSAWKGSRAYSAWRYATKWIPIMREATFEIAKTDGLYDYENGIFYRLIKPEGKDDYVWTILKCY